MVVSQLASMNVLRRSASAVALLEKQMQLIVSCRRPKLRGTARCHSTIPSTIHDNHPVASEQEHIIILGGGIAGLSTCHYLLRQTQQCKSARITLIDKNDDALPTSSSKSTSYEQQMCEQMHRAIPSRRNGNVLCPSLTVPWTTRSLWKEVFWPGLKSYLSSDESIKPPSISFDWPSLIMDRNMWSFGTHFLLQKLLFGRPEHQSNKSILEYNMKCLDDPSDELVQSIEYGRCAIGTKRLDGSIKDGDSSGDIGLFCRGLLDKLVTNNEDRLTVISGEDALQFEVKGDELQGVTTMDREGNRITRDADKIVVAMGGNSTPLCNDIRVPCPVYPAKGHLVTVSSEIDYKYNITLDGGVGYAAPMANVDSEGRRLYRLSGFVDFNPSITADHDRIEALIEAARVHLPDSKMIDASACHRPISADDRPLIGPSARYHNLYMCTGFGSRGWSIGLGSGKVLASQILDTSCDIDIEPYLPSRFSLGWK